MRAFSNGTLKSSDESGQGSDHGEEHEIAAPRLRQGSQRRSFSSLRGSPSQPKQSPGLPRFARNDETRAGQDDKRMLLNNLRLRELVGCDVL
ncbi:MAG: hypothetical protein WBH01_01140 [Dehalococcoidia bacterium]